MGDNMTLKINPETRDLVINSEGNFEQIYDDNTIMQNVRNTLLTWKAEFFADDEHGTEYDRILGQPDNEIDFDDVEEVIREAVLQEPDVERVEEIRVVYEGRGITAEVTMTFVDGETASLEVTV